MTASGEQMTGYHPVINTADYLESIVFPTLLTTFFKIGFLRSKVVFLQIGTYIHLISIAAITACKWWSRGVAVKYTGIIKMPLDVLISMFYYQRYKTVLRTNLKFKIMLA